jgi:NADPH2:quinone reductase
MRAVVITAHGGPEVLEIQERQTPQPGVGEVRVRIHASALNRADISQRLGRYPAPPGSPPDIPGLEYAGEVDTLGRGSSLWNAGDRVMGIAGGGAHAEFLCVHEREVIPAPSGLSMEECAAIPEAFLTAYDALFDKLDLESGETVLIHAAGSGVGTAAIQLARVAGAATIGTSRSRSKLDKCLELGLTAGFHVRDDDWAQRLLGEIRPSSIHAVLDLVGASYLKGNLEVLGIRGRMVSVGLTAGSRAELDMGVLMRKRITLIGTVLRARPLEEKISLARKFSERVVPLFVDKKLRPVIDRSVSFADIAAAHGAMESNETFGKIVLVWS